MSQYKCIQLEQADGVRVVQLIDEKVMDPLRIELLGKELLSLSDADAPPFLVLSFSAVKFFSSAAINKLIVLERRIKARGGKLLLTNLRPEIRDVFGFTHLDSHFRIRESHDAAVAELAADQK